MTDQDPRVMEGNWNTTEVWPVPVECLMNGMNAPESHLMFGGNHMLPPHFRHRFQSPVCLSTAHLGPPPGTIDQINVSIPTHSMVEGNQVSVDSSVGSAERNDPDTHSISQPMTIGNSDVLEETDEASDEDEEDEEDGEEEDAVPMSLVHDQHQQQHSQSVSMSHPIDSEALVQCQRQDALQVNSLQGDPMQQQQQGPMISTMSQEQCQHQKSALVNNAMTHAHSHPAPNSSLAHALPPPQLPHQHPHPHSHPLAGNSMIANPLSIPIQQQQQQQQQANDFPNNSIPQPNDNNSGGNCDPNLGYTVQGKMYYEGRVVLHLKQLRNSFGGMNGGFHSSGFSSCAEADLSKNNNLMGCAICRLRNPDTQNSQRQKEAHRHSVKGVLFTFEDCLIVELYPDHIPINSNPLDPKPPPPPVPPEPPKTNHPMPISSYINSQPPPQPPPHAPTNGKRMMNHGMEDHMDPLSAVIVANKHHQQPTHHHQPHPHELHQQPNTEESSWWDDFESEDELKRTEGSEGHESRGIVAMKLNAEHHNSSLQQIHAHSQEQRSEQSVDPASAAMLSHDLLEPHSCMANDVVTLGQPPEIPSVQSIVPLEIDLSAPNSVGISEDSSSHSVELSSQQQCEEGECEEEEPQMVVVEVVVSDKDVVPEVRTAGDYEIKNNSSRPTNSATKYSCPMCIRSFHLKKMLKSHLEEMHHSGNPYRCVQCEAQFADERRLRKHSCTLSVQTLKSRERKLAFISVFDRGSESENKAVSLISGGSRHSETQEDTESEEDFFEDSVTVSDIEEDNVSNVTRENSSEEEDDEDDEEVFPDLPIVTSGKRKSKQIGTTTKKEKKSKSENISVEYLNGRVRMKPDVFQDEDEDEEDDYEDENENSQDENDYECVVDSQCVEDKKISPDCKKLIPPPSRSNRDREDTRVIRVSGKSTSFKNGKSINSKKKSKKGGKPFHCGICGKGFSVERRLENHKASHATERYSQCEKCGKRFARKDKLMRHMYVHSEEKMFVCDICQKRFSRRDKLSDHLKSHGTDEIHNCPMCQKQFLRPDILKQHVKLHGMGNKHQCPECLRFVTGKDRLEKHMARHEEAKALGQTLLCPLCTKYFIQRQSLKAHIKKFHPEALKILNLDQQNVSQSQPINSSVKSSKSSKSTLSYSSSDLSSAIHCQSSLSGVVSRNSNSLLLDEMITSKNVSNKERPFACKYCPRLFVRKIALKKHLRKHPQEHLKIRDEPTESDQCSEEEEEAEAERGEEVSVPCSHEVDSVSGSVVSSSGCTTVTTHDIQSIISVPSTATATTTSNGRRSSSLLSSSNSSSSSSGSSSSNSSSTPPMSLIHISAPSPAPPSNPLPPTPPLHHQLPLSSTSISCNGGADIISVSPVTHIPLPLSQSLANVSQANAQVILENAASEMSHFAVASHQHAAAVAAAHHHHVHHAQQHMPSPHAHYSSSAHNFLSAASICSVSSPQSSLHQQTVTTSAATQPSTDSAPAQLPSSPISHSSQVGQLHPHLSHQLTVPLQHHVNVSMTPSPTMCGSSYLLAAYPHYSYQ